MDVVGVLVFGLRFMFGSPSCLGWHPHLDGDFVVCADMGYVRGSLQRVGVEDGGRLGNHCWCYWRFVKHCGHLWPFVEGGANGSMAVCCGGHSWPVIDPSGGHLLMVVMGSCGPSILVMGTVDIIGHDRSLSILEVGPHGQLSMVVVGTHCVSWRL